MAFWDLANWGERIALTGSHGTWRYSDLAALSKQWLESLDRLRSRTLGFLLFERCPSAMAAYAACMQSGRHVPLLLPPDLQQAQLAALIEIYQPDWLALPRALDAFPQNTSHEDMRLYRLQGGHFLHPDLALLLATSGSTGSAKLVRLSAAAVDANAQSIATYLALTEQDRAISTLPFAYSFGMSVVNSHWVVGASMVLTTESVLSKGFWEIATTQAITSISNVPGGFEMLARAKLDQRGLTSLRYLAQAGGHLRTDLVKHFDALCRAQQWQFFVMYGQTEAAPRISYVPPHRLADKVGSIGIAIPGGALALAEDSGELVYSGPNVMLGYAETAADLALGDQCQGVLATGDLARRDEDGFYYLTGRLKRFVKLSGIRLNLDSIEQQLSAHLGGAIAVTGTDDGIVLWTLNEAGIDAQAAQAAAKSLFNLFHGHVRVRSVAAFPVLASGKLDYAALTAQMAGE
jgi:long-chain acyl-CoA synthetase